MNRLREYTFTDYLNAIRKWEYAMTAPDQDILNYCHYDKVKYVPWQKYDLFARTAYLDGWTYEDVKDKNMIIHFAGEKPWNFKVTCYEIEKFWWEYAAKTPVYQTLMENFLEQALTDDHYRSEAIRLQGEKQRLSAAVDEAKKILDKLKSSKR